MTTLDPGSPTDSNAEGTTADAVRTVVLQVSGVADLHPGQFGEVATYLPGRRVAGVRVHDDRTEVHIVLRWRAPAQATAAAVAAAVAAITGTAVYVHIQDVASPR